VTRSFVLSGDLAHPFVLVACALAAVSFALLLVELFRHGGARRGRRPAALIAGTGALSVAALLAAVLRPVAVASKSVLVGPKVVVLVDASRSIDLPGLGGTRRQAAQLALAELDKRAAEVRLGRFAFGDGTPIALDAEVSPGAAATGAPPPSADPLAGVRPFLRSDLGSALEVVARTAGERPSAIVVLSDGRLDRPSATGAGEAVQAALGSLEIPVHTVALATTPPADASIRQVMAAGAAVAHQPFSLRVEVGCDGGLVCGDIPVTASELRDQGPPAVLAKGTAHVGGTGTATIELSMTVERAGARILEVSIDAPPGDTIPENDRRFVAIEVTRDRVRVLHVAGRPTYDVRALRMWLKSDASVDLVAFFILRTQGSDVHATQDELALIPFPVDELFNEQLPTFDAVVLQDFNFEPYDPQNHFRVYLNNLADYVSKGGGLIMVGGPNAFGPGHYAGSRLAEVLPVDLEAGHRPLGIDLSLFTPELTEAGRSAPVLAPLRALIGAELPEMPGTNVLGDARRGATTLMVHPTRKTTSGAPMPVLALGEHGSGRTIALGIDGSHRLLFSNFAASAAGRAHGAFWDAMLGWLMRDPRFEPAAVDVKGGCLAGEEETLVLRPLPGQKGTAAVIIRRLGSGEAVRTLHAPLDGSGAAVDLPAGKLDAGGYSATVEIGLGDGKDPAAEGAGTAGPGTRRDFACEKGGDEWADSRPDIDRLKAIAAANHGTFVLAPDAGSLPLPAATQVAAERKVAPILPPWAWTFAAAVALGAHWMVRRRGGLS
jgi:uncharacterized membrane protein